MNIPRSFLHAMKSFESLLSPRVFHGLCVIACARVVSRGPSTFTSLALLTHKLPYSGYWQHFFSRYCFSTAPLCWALDSLILKTFFTEGDRISVSVDGTTCLHKGPRGFGRAKHRDGVRSSHGTLNPLMGHKWVVLSIVVRVPGSERAWALPVCSKLCIRWYGGAKRDVSLISRKGYWYRKKQGVVHVKWVHVRDLSGTHRDEYLYTTDTRLRDEEIVSLFCDRWATEVTFQECKQHLHLETTRTLSQKSVQRVVPLMFGLYSMIVLAHTRRSQKTIKVGISHNWPGKNGLTFSDLLVAMRQEYWDVEIKDMRQKQGGRPLVPRRYREKLLRALTLAA